MAGEGAAPPSGSDAVSGSGLVGGGNLAAPVAERIAEAGGRLEDERRLVTALFADVSGFTALSQRLDPEELQDVISPVLEMLAAVVSRFGGFVDKFAGDAVLALFGTPVAHEDDPERAVGAALEMHRRLPGVLERIGPLARELELHIGVNTGHIVARQLGADEQAAYSVLGSAVNLAARLESVTPSGQTFVGALTRELTTARFAYESAGTFELKGFDDPVPAWRLLGKRAEVVDLPGGPLLGREQELARGMAALDAARSDRSAVATVVGEAGIGKSRLVAELVSRARHDGASVLDGGVPSYGRELSHGVIREVVRSLARQHDGRGDPDAALGGLLDELGCSWAASYLAPLLTGELGDVEPEAFRRGLHRALEEVLTGLRARGPVVVAIHDLHWADDDSLALLTDLLRTAVPGVAVVLSSRPDGLDRLEDVLAEAAGERVDVTLAGLDRAAIEALVQAELGARAAAVLVDHVLARAEGNPFLAQQIVASLREVGALVDGETGWTLSADHDPSTLPPSVEGLLGARIDRLPLATAELLQVLAVLGQDAPAPLLAAVAEVTDPSPALGELTRAGLVDQVPGGDGVTVRHALVREVAYQRLVRRRRRALHGRAATVIEQRLGRSGETIEVIAHHLAAADAGVPAVDALSEAAAHAAAMYANTAAIDHLVQALDHIERHGVREEARGGLALRLGQLRELVGDYDAAAQAYILARELTGDVDAWRGLAACCRRAGDHDAAHVALDAGFAALPDGADPRPLWLERGWALQAGGRLEEAEVALRRGLELGADRADRLQGELGLHLAGVLEHLDRVQDARAVVEDARRCLEAAGERTMLARSARVYGGILARAGDHEAAEQVLRAGIAVADELGALEEIAGARLNLAFLRYEHADLADAIRLTREALEEFERVGHRSGRIIGGCNLATMLAEAGHADEAVAVGQRALALADEVGDDYHAGDALDGLARAYLAVGDRDRAAAAAREAAERYDRVGATSWAEEARQLAREAQQPAG